MGQQIRKVTKRRRRIEYLKRKKEQSKLNSNAPIRLAVPVAKDAKPAAKRSWCWHRWQCCLIISSTVSAAL